MLTVLMVTGMALGLSATGCVSAHRVISDGFGPENKKFKDFYQDFGYMDLYMVNCVITLIERVVITSVLIASIIKFFKAKSLVS